ncbi:MAG: DUF5110 domain-containing protein [Candidatus Marinimicrobia bacterium]|nr:DUF5110 domain-containing protein [Candidatus Neomarinimicrobiota bacterium]
MKCIVNGIEDRLIGNMEEEPMNRWKYFFIVALMILAGGSLFSQEYNPVADPDAVVKSGNARFTVLTPGLIRMEWAGDGIFEDRASLVFVNRKLPVPKYKTKTKRGWLQLKTEKLTLQYKIGNGRFSEENLRIEFNKDGVPKEWIPGMENKGNLLGTIRTLDGFDGTIMNWSTKKPIALKPGILSRDGWVLIDDTNRPLFDNSDWQWVTVRPEKESQDLYFFCYGSDYKTALKDFISVAGKIALPPKYAFGIWWSRYWEYTDLEFRELIKEFEIHNVPLDVLVVDMDWHITSKPEWYKDGKKIKDQAGEQIGWTGFTWNRNYFPEPKDFLRWTEEKGLKVCMNLHPASGIQPHEEKYPEMARAMGIDPATKQYVPFDIVNRDFAENFMKIILHPMEADGVDFWWLDWQQWSTTKIPGVNPTFYLNYVFFSDMERRNKKRPIIFHRYGGLGNHRYQIGFSGDAFINWKSLDYQPYFTATAANVGFGFWSHDIGGHMYGESTPELYTRWVQFGAFSPILRTHCTKAGHEGGIERRIWAYPLEYFYAMREAFLLRKALLPYIYTAAREAYDTGISMCHPMYYEYPKEENAYRFPNQYMFGDDLLLAPVTQPIGQDSLFVQKDIWLPDGEWIEWHSGTVLKGEKVVQRSFCIDEIPIYVRAGAIIPMVPEPECGKTDDDHTLILNVFPGKSGECTIYDDAGDDNQYKNGACSFTHVVSTNTGKSQKVLVEAVKGRYPGMPESRDYEIRFLNRFPPESVRINGIEIPYQADGGANSWRYNGNDQSIRVYTSEMSVHRNVKIECRFTDTDIEALSGKKGQFADMIKFMKFLAKNNWDKSRYSNDLVVHAAQTGHRMSLNPENAVEEIKNFDSEWQKVLEMVEANASEKAGYQAYSDLLKRFTSVK